MENKKTMEFKPGDLCKLSVDLYSVNSRRGYQGDAARTYKFNCKNIFQKNFFAIFLGSYPDPLYVRTNRGEIIMHFIHGWLIKDEVCFFSDSTIKYFILVQRSKND